MCKVFAKLWYYGGQGYNEASQIKTHLNYISLFISCALYINVHIDISEFTQSCHIPELITTKSEV